MRSQAPMQLKFGLSGRHPRSQDRRRPSRRHPLGLVERLEGRSLLTAAGEWAFALGGPSPDRVRHATVAPGGNLYVTGFFRGKVDFAPADSARPDAAAMLTSGGNGASQDAFVAKYAPDGSFLWARHMGGAN